MAFCHPDNMQISCKPCHRIKSYADRMGWSFERAKIEKEAIEFSKLSVNAQKDELAVHGITLDRNNAKARREAYVTFLIQRMEA